MPSSQPSSNQADINSSSNRTFRLSSMPVGTNNQASTKIVWILRILLIFFILNKCLSSSRNQNQNRQSLKKWPHDKPLNFPEFKVMLNLQWGPTFASKSDIALNELVSYLNAYNKYRFTIHGLRLKTYGRVKAPENCCVGENVFTSDQQDDIQNLQLALDDVLLDKLDEFWPSFSEKGYRHFWASQW